MSVCETECSCGSSVTNDVDIEILLKPFECDDIDDFFVINCEMDIQCDEDYHEIFPTTISGDQPYKVTEEILKGKYVTGHVILNQCL